MKLVRYNIRGTSHPITIAGQPKPVRVSHWCVCGKSRADCVRRINAVAPHAMMTDHELRVYGSATWGNDMEGITPTPGVWFTTSYNTPVIKAA